MVGCWRDNGSYHRYLLLTPENVKSAASAVATIGGAWGRNFGFLCSRGGAGAWMTSVGRVETSCGLIVSRSDTLFFFSLKWWIPSHGLHRRGRVRGPASPQPHARRTGETFPFSPSSSPSSSSVSGYGYGSLSPPRRPRLYLGMDRSVLLVVLVCIWGMDRSVLLVVLVCIWGMDRSVLLVVLVGLHDGTHIPPFHAVLVPQLLHRD